MKKQAIDWRQVQSKRDINNYIQLVPRSWLGINQDLNLKADRMCLSGEIKKKQEATEIHSVE